MVSVHPVCVSVIRGCSRWCALVLFRLLPRGFSNGDLRTHLAELLGEQFIQGKMTYDLRRLRLHGLIERTPKSNRYQVTDFGFRSALFLTRAYTRLLRPGLAVVTDKQAPVPTMLHKALLSVDRAIERIWTQQRIAA